jgi:hypothetical protein
VSRQRKTSGLGDSPITRVRGGTRDRLRDAGSKELALLAKKIGNGQLGALLGASKEKRDALLRFIQRRLAQVRAAQVAEQRELADKREWWQRVARGKPGFHLPDPTRWHAVAHQYKKAADAICAGDLGRGAHLLDVAVRTERATFDTVPDQVELPAVVDGPEAHADERPFIEEGEGCPPTQAPEISRVAGEIVRVSETLDPFGVTRDNPTHRWWETPEEEAEDPKKKKPEGKPGEAAQQQLPEVRSEAQAHVDEELKKEERIAAPHVEPAAREQRPRRGKRTEG